MKNVPLLPALKVINPAFDASWILAKQIGRAEYAQPIVVPHYSKFLPPLQTPVEGLWSACMAQTYPEDRGQNYAIRIGRDAADAIVASLR